MSGLEETVRGGKVCRLSFAISLKDAYSGGRPQGIVELIIDGHEKPVLNPSGYYTFLNLPAGRYQLKVVSENYLDEKVMVNVEDKLFAVVEISLMPKTCYPFPPGVTLVRGRLRDFRGAIAGAVLTGSLSESRFFGRTDERGEFVIFFDPLKDEEVMKEGKMTYVKGPDAKGNRKDILISGEYHGKDGRLLQIETRLDDIAVGTTNFRDLVLTTARTPSPTKPCEEKTHGTVPKGAAAESKTNVSRAEDIFSPYDRYDFPEFF